jgi:hypothetical protein
LLLTLSDYRARLSKIETRVLRVLVIDPSSSNLSRIWNSLGCSVRKRNWFFSEFSYTLTFNPISTIEISSWLGRSFWVKKLAQIIWILKRSTKNVRVLARTKTWLQQANFICVKIF